MTEVLSNSSSLLNEISADGDSSQLSQPTPVPAIDDNAYNGADGSGPATVGTNLKSHVPLTSELISNNLSVLARTGNGLNHAYVKLEIHDKGLTSIDGIDQYPHLRYIDLSQNQIREVAALSYLEFLIAVDFHGNQIRSIPSALDKCKFLQSANFANNQLLLLDVESWPLLRYLNLNKNEFMDMNLRNFPELRQLECRNNKLTSTSGINAPNLEKLYLAENNINRIEGLETMSNLQLIHLRDNKLEKLDGFSGISLPSLTYLNLRHNQITDVEELAKLAKFTKLQHLVTIENPFSESETYRLEVLAMLPFIQILDKEPVSAEEREEALSFASELKQRKAEERAAAEALRKQEEEEAAAAAAEVLLQSKQSENAENPEGSEAPQEGNSEETGEATDGVDAADDQAESNPTE